MDISRDDYKFIVTGDSISRGVVYDETKCKYTVIQDNYVSLLQNSLKGIVHNTARFGNTIIRGIGKLKDDVFNKKPDVVLIEFGGNDCDFNWDEIALNPEAEHSPKTDFDVFKSKLRETVDFLKSNHVTPVLMTLPPLNADKYFKWISRNNPLSEINILKWLGSVTRIYWWQERYSSIITKVAEETGTRWIDIRGAFLQHPDFSDFLCMDGIHPNEHGHKLIAEKVLEYIRSGYDFLLKDHADPIPEC